MASISEIKRTLAEAQRQAGAIARSRDDGEIRILAIAIAETARAAGELAKHIDQ